MDPSADSIARRPGCEQRLGHLHRHIGVNGRFTVQQGAVDRVAVVLPKPSPSRNPPGEAVEGERTGLLCSGMA
ncbi:hypothetical protein ACFWYA_17815 [Streptomyces sp. NPDC059011]|uniref:hypothetical protein n=1 Tax=Streptomyces TaxID=1883 RepID=UPI003699A6ED